MPKSPHPPHERLVAYGQGRLTEADADTVERHLAGCPDCLSKVENTPDDAVVGLVRASLPSGGQTASAATRTEYRGLTHFARGGLGEVLIARDTIVGRDVAVKRLLPNTDDRPERRKRFLREAAVTGRLEHPGVAPVYGVGEDEDGQPCYAMRFVPGKTLADAIRELHAAGPITAAGLRPLLSRFVALCATVAYAHSRGVIHRDIKPANVAVGSFGETILLDWGLAQTDDSVDELSDEHSGDSSHAFDRFQTATGTILGTPGFMAPEQAVGKRVGPAADVYSLGVTLRTMLTGRSPEVIASSFSALMAIARRATSTDPAARYPGALELAADVERWLADEPVSACPDPLAVRVRRFIRRHQTASAAAVVLLIATTVSLGTGAALLGREQQKTAKALDAESRERAKAESVLDYVDKHVFAAGRPKSRGGLGKDVKLAEALAAALPAVDKSFAEQPLTEARLRMTLGASFQYLGNAKSAEHQFLAARRLYEANLGPEHPDTLTSMHQLATSLAGLGRDQAALELREKTLTLRRAVLGPDHLDTLKSVNNLANSYAELNRTDDALRLRQEVYAGRLAQLGPEHPDTLSSMHNLANSYHDLGRYAEALDLREIVFSRRRALLGHDHLDTLMSRGHVAISLQALGRYEEALEHRQYVAKAQSQQLGADHPDTLTTLSNLAVTYSSLKRHEEALKLRQQVLATRQAKLGLDHLDTLVSLSSLANSYADLGQYDEALKRHQETRARRMAQLERDHPDVLKSQSNVADSLRGLGRNEEALKLRQEVLTRRRERLGPDHPDTLKSMSDVADSLIAMGRGSEAVTVIDECVRRSMDARLIAGVLSLRLRYFAEKKDPTGCRQTAEMWENLNRPDADSFVTAARLRALASAVTGAEDADRAMAWLTKAIAAGYKDTKELETKGEFSALNDRDDFKKLLAEMKSRAGQK